MTDEAVAVECDLDEPLDKVWRALTDPDLLAQWLAPEEEGAQIGEVVEVDPGREVRVGWRDERDSVVTFTVTEQEGGVHLRIVHEPVAAPVLMSAPRRPLPRAARSVARRAPRMMMRKAA
jgi:uncharacterized protein YndB with AHSA1/START domain